jgi:hypothetical protein
MSNEDHANATTVHGIVRARNKSEFLVAPQSVVDDKKLALDVGLSCPDREP